MTIIQDFLQEAVGKPIEEEAKSSGNSQGTDTLGLLGLLAGLLVGGGAAVHQSDQSRRNANAQIRHSQNIQRANADIAEKAALASYDQIALRQVQEAAAASALIEANRKRAVAAAGTARTAAVEAGGLGGSFDALLGDYARLEAEFTGRVASNLTATSRQLQLQAEQARSQFAGNVLSASPPPVPRPDYLGAALRVVGSSAIAIGGFSEAQRQGRSQGFGTGLRFGAGG